MEAVLPTVRYSDNNRSNSLQHQRDQLLKQLESADGSGREGKLSDSRSRYNSVMDQLSEERLGTLRDPLRALPREIWIPILKEAASYYPDAINGILILTLVGIEWRNTLLTTPDLWTHITIDEEPDPDLLAKLVTALMLSGNLSIQLAIRASMPYWESVLPILQQNAARIASILILHPAYLVTHGFKDPNPMVHLGNMPSLKSLCHERGVQQELYGILDQTPRIVQLSGFNLSATDMRHPHLVGLQHCTTTEPLDELMSHLEPFPRLRSLSLTSYGRDSWNVMGLQSNTRDRSIHPPPKSSHLDLQHLIFYQDKPKVALDIVRMARSLTTLDIVIGSDWKSLKGLIEILPITLVDLCIRLDWCNSRIKFSPVEPIANLKTLSLAIPNLYIQNPSNATIEVQHLNMISFLDHIRTCMASVRDLRIDPYLQDATYTKGRDLGQIFTAQPSLYDACNAVLRCLNSLKHLHNLSIISLEEGPLLPFNACIKLQLDALKIFGNSATTASFLTGVHSYRPVVLSCTGVSPAAEGRMNPIDIHPVVIIAVKTLRWSWSPIIGDVGKFPSLRNLTFDSCGMAVTSDFCIQLILRPSDCPHLEQIQFSCHLLEWDWLVLMLERRNFLIDQNVSPIRSLAFHRPPAPSLSQILVRLLRRECHKRPSNKELSLEEVAETYFDPTIESCHSCCFSLTFCPSKPKSGPFDGEWSSCEAPAIRDFDTRARDPPLPDSTEQWLKDRPNRHLRWNKLFAESSFSRPYSCNVGVVRYDTILTDLGPLCGEVVSDN